MISREDVAKELYVQRWVRTGNTRESSEAAWKAGWANQDIKECRVDADAILALIQPESSVPVQRDERAEKLGEQLDAMVAECNANHRIISRLEERVRELDAAWLRHTWPCGHISEGTGDEPDRCRICVAEARVRNAEALAANLRRLDNERALEVMRLRARVQELEGQLDEIARSELAQVTARNAVVEAADDYERLWMKVHDSGGATRDDRVRIGYVRGHLFAAVRALRAAEVTPAAGVAFMLPEPVPATPIPPDPRDVVVEAAEFLVMLPAGGPSEEATERYEALVRAVRALRTPEGRG